MEIPELSIHRTVDAETYRLVGTLVAEATAADGHPALSEHKRLELGAALTRAARPDGRFTAILARRPGGHDLVGYAQVSAVGPSGDTLAIEVAVAPGARDPLLSVVDALLAAALGEAGRLGARSVRFWAAGATPAHDRIARAHGLLPERDLVQMRCRLPLEGTGPEPTLRPFRTGRDEEAWLRANNRAFADHPEQGVWDLATLLEREGEPWFDPDGFLLLEEDGRLAGSVWTKVHAGADPPMGEIYVIAVDPAFQGRGYGRALTLAGLAHLARAGLTVGMLYVDAANAPAVALYRSLGFVEHHVDRAYVGRPPSPPADRDDGS